jgi:hypothetical protein
MVKIKQYQDQLNNLDIKAPHDGMLIINKWWNGEKFRAGDAAALKEILAGIFFHFLDRERT